MLDLINMSSPLAQKTSLHWLVKPVGSYTQSATTYIYIKVSFMLFLGHGQDDDSELAIQDKLLQNFIDWSIC